MPHAYPAAESGATDRRVLPPAVPIIRVAGTRASLPLQVPAIGQTAARRAEPSRVRRFGSAGMRLGLQVTGRVNRPGR
jgi:hypothetical protein